MFQPQKIYNQPHMKYLGLFILIGFASLSIFGAFGMHAFTEDHNSGCIVATSQSADCPREINPFDSLALHAGIFKNFSDAVFGGIGAFALALSMLSAMAMLLGFVIFDLNRPKITVARRQTSPDSWNPPSKYDFNRWLALHEESPAFS